MTVFVARIAVAHLGMSLGEVKHQLIRIRGKRPFVHAKQTDDWKRHASERAHRGKGDGSGLSSNGTMSHLELVGERRVHGQGLDQTGGL